MNKIKFIKKVKANFIRFKLHRIIGPFAELMIFAGYLSRLSKWADKNKKSLSYNDFYNKSPLHKERVQLYQHVLDLENLAATELNYIEFGVGRGNSMRWWSEKNNAPATRFFGFDTFEGLPEDWGAYKAGMFNVEGKFPDIDNDRITFVKGLFQDTLLNALPKMDFKQRTILHLDGDLYSSTMFPMAILYPYLKPGDLLIFDEFGVPLHEFRAFEDFIQSFYIKLEPIGAINNYLEVVFKVVDEKA